MAHVKETKFRSVAFCVNFNRQYEDDTFLMKHYLRNEYKVLRLRMSRTMKLPRGIVLDTDSLKMSKLRLFVSDRLCNINNAVLARFGPVVLRRQAFRHLIGENVGASCEEAYFIPGKMRSFRY